MEYNIERQELINNYMESGFNRDVILSINTKNRKDVVDKNLAIRDDGLKLAGLRSQGVNPYAFFGGQRPSLFLRSGLEYLVGNVNAESPLAPQFV